MPISTDPLIGLTSGVLGTAAAVHVVWGLRLPLPGVDQAAMAEAVAGTQEVPSPAACFAVAGALGAASLLVAGVPSRFPRLRRSGQVGVAAVLAGRAILGAAGRTDLVSPGKPSERFLHWDRRVYTPLCGFLAAGAARAALSPDS